MRASSKSKSVRAKTSHRRMQRPKVAALEEILGKPLRVLDDGFVRLIDYMGDEPAVVQAARISYGLGTKRLHEDRGLIRYLMRHMHNTPFEMCEIKLNVRVPMDTWRQWIRHRTANVNEYSTRYSLAIDAAQRTEPNDWRTQSLDNRQGSSGKLPIEIGRRLSSIERQIQLKTRRVYEARIAAGVAREQARKDLPLSTYTEAYWKIDLNNLLRFLELRMSTDAQTEIRAYATLIGEEIVAKWLPMVWEAFMDYRYNALRLSEVEADIVRALIANDRTTAHKLAVRSGLIKPGKDGMFASNPERRELEEKLRRFGLKSPWQ